MKHKVWHKYAIVYLVAAALILIATNLIARPFYQSDNMKRHKARIYKECVVISDEYISEYKLSGFTLETFLLQMKAVRMMLDADIWVVGADGRMIAV